MLHRIRFWVLDVLRRALGRMIAWTTTGTASQALLVRVDDGSRDGKLYRHLNVGKAEHEIVDGSSFLILTDYWGNRIASYRTSLVRYTRARTARCLDQLRLVQVVRS